MALSGRLGRVLYAAVTHFVKHMFQRRWDELVMLDEVFELGVS